MIRSSAPGSPERAAEYSYTAAASGRFLVNIDPTTLPAGGALTTDNFEDADFGASYGLSDIGNDFGYSLPGTISLTKSSNATPALQPGDRIDYTLTVTNTGSTMQTGITVSDPLPPGTTYVPGSTVASWGGTAAAVPATENWEATTSTWVGGTGPWSTPGWTEVGESDGANNGDTRVDSFFGSERLRLRDNNNGGEGVERSIDLSGYSSATLSFVYRRTDLDNANDYAAVQVSTNGGPFSEIARFAGPGEDAGFLTSSHDLTPHLSPNTRIRFITSPNMGGGDEVYFDDIAITGQTANPVTKSNAVGDPDPLVDGVPAQLVLPADGVNLGPGESLTVLFGVRVNVPAPATSVVNTAQASSDQSPPDTETRIDPLRVASIGDTVWEDLDADGIRDPAEPGLADITVELLDAGGATLLSTTTASDGRYSLGWLPAGAYSVRFTRPAGYLFSPRDQGGLDTLDSDPDTTSGLTGPVTLTSGQTDRTVDAGMFRPASLGDRVWDDLDGDGVQDPGEPGVGGVTVELLDTGGAVVGSTSTAGDGSYTLSDVVPGTYAVRVIYPPGTVGSPVDQGADDAVDSDADPTTGRSSSVTLTSGQSRLDIDFGLYTPAVIGDRVWDDLDGDGLQDPGEPGIAGASVTLLDSGGAVVATTSTGAAGDYRFDGLDPGDYSVWFTGPAGYRRTAPNVGGDDSSDSDADVITGETGTINVISGTVDDSVDAGFYRPMRLGDFVWVDSDGDGVQDAGERGASGLTVNLLSSSGGVIASTITGPDGSYGFTDLDPAVYGIEVLGGGFDFTSQDQGPDDAADSDVDPATGRTALFVMSSGNDRTTVDAGIRPAIIGDFVWEDLDGDGVQDAGESGIDDVTVRLLDGAGTVIETTTTGVDGTYSFAVGPGDYRIEFLAPPGRRFVPAGAGADTTVDSDADPSTGRSGLITISDRSGDLTIDAGLYTPIALGDFVWDDLDGDGVQDAGEPGLAGVAVELRDSIGTVIDTTSTDAAGSYGFVDLAPGDYSVAFALPAAYQFTAADQGGDDAADSDADPGSGVSGTIVLTSGVDDQGVDAGAYRLGTIGDFVWVDLDRDGVQDAGEPGLAGVTANLFDAGGLPAGSTVTAADGSYALTNVVPGDYTMVFDAPGYTFTGQDAGADDAVDSDVDSSGTTATVTMTSGATLSDVDAGVEPMNLGNFVWVDSDGDGVQDPGEPGLAGVTVELLDGVGAVIATTSTAVDGTYGFAVASGTYTVRFVAPAGFVFTGRDADGDDAVDSDADATGTTAAVILAGPDDIVTVDAGVFETAGVGDRVWDDLDGDGVQDPGEPGVGGVTVELLDSAGGAIGSVTTAGDGSYSFTGLAPGSYSVRVVYPVGAVGSPADQGGDDAVDSDADPTTGQSSPVVLSSGQVDVDLDVGVYTPAVVGDFVWDDLDGDGVQDVGEPGVAGVVVELLDAAGGVVDSTVTAGDGSYQFVGVVPGGYRVRFVAPAGFGLTAKDQGGDDTVDSDAFVLTGRTEVFSVVSGDVIDSVDAGVVADASIGDRVWFDVDSDGVQGSGEPGVGGVTVDLLDAGGAVVASTTTAGDGSYVFGGLWPGEYSVAVDPSLSFTTRDAGADDAVDSDVDALGETGTVTLTSGATVSDVDAGVVPSSIGDRVWVDSDGDGRQDAGESGVAGVTVELLDAGGAVVASTTTAGDGSYGFGLLLPGDYGVRFAAPAGFVFTVADAGVDTLDSDADASGLTATMSLPGATVNNNVDAGVFETAGVGDRVWDDLDGDGVQDPGEPGVGGVTVELLDAGGATIDSTTTAADGTYGFSGLTPGTYTLELRGAGWCCADGG